MCGKVKKQSSIHKKTAMVVVLAYFFVTTAVDLFHTESCAAGQSSRRAANAILDNDPCPACMFKAGSNSVEPVCQSPLVGLDIDLLAQPVLHSTLALRTQWTSSVMLRAPPSSAVS